MFLDVEIERGGENGRLLLLQSGLYSLPVANDIQLRICQRQPRAVSGNDTCFVRPVHFHPADRENPCPIDRHIERRGKKGRKKRKLAIEQWLERYIYCVDKIHKMFRIYKK